MINRLPKIEQKKNQPMFCHRLPPVVITIQETDQSGNVVNKFQLQPIVCYGPQCSYYCEIEGMCSDKCEHLITHEYPGCDHTDDGEEISG